MREQGRCRTKGGGISGEKNMIIICIYFIKLQGQLRSTCKNVDFKF